MSLIIDAWMQFPNRTFLLDPMFDSLRRWPTHWRGLAAGNPDIAPDEVLRRFGGAGVAKVVASAWWGPGGAMIPNEEVAALVERHPERVVGIASVDLRRPMDAVRELRRCVRTLGLRGLRVLPWLWGLPPDDRRYYPLYVECVELGVPFCLQVGHAGPMCPSEPGRPIPYLDHVAHEFPELTIVGGHIGFPWVGEMISLMMKHANVFVDTSAYKPSRYPREFVDFLRGPGRRKVLFGTNYPRTPSRSPSGSWPCWRRPSCRAGRWWWRWTTPWSAAGADGSGRAGSTATRCAPRAGTSSRRAGCAGSCSCSSCRCPGRGGPGRCPS